MIIGVGIDMVKVGKIKAVIGRWGDDFIGRVFNSEEVENIREGRMYYQRLAARFAAKEAVIKAVPGKYSLAFKDILILNRNDGAPYCAFKINGVDENIFLSITHIKDYAAAVAVVEKKS